jgi:hypothetical protein
VTRSVVVRRRILQRTLVPALVALGGAALDGCGGTTEPLPNPVPVLDSASPSAIPLGSPNAVITLYGSGFVPYSRARWNGEDRPTTYVSESRMTITADSTDLAFSYIFKASIFVYNPPPAGGQSGQVIITLTQ